MILVRPYADDDAPAVKTIYQSQKLDYAEPDWSKMLVSAVVEVDGQISMAAFLRKTAEAYLLVDPASPLRKRDRLGHLLMLHHELIQPAKRVGFEDVNCFLSPEMEARKFGKLLMHLGWERPLWTCYSREVK